MNNGRINQTGGAAREIDINRATLYRWIARDEVTVIKLGKTPVILRSEVDRLRSIGAKRKYVRHKPLLSLRAERSNLHQSSLLPRVKQPILP